MEEASQMQMEALEEVGLAPTRRNLHYLRSTALDHPELALYVRHNTCRDGDLCCVGGSAPSLSLLSLDNEPVQWPPADLREGVPLVVVAGSAT